MKGALWRQILADILGTDLVETNTTEGGAFGAALLAGVGCRCLERCSNCLCRNRADYPHYSLRSATHRLNYQNSYIIYQSLYPLLQSTFTKIG